MSTKTLIASLLLTAVPASQFSVAPAGYKVTLTETNGLVASSDYTVPMDSTAVSFSVPAGTYVASVVLVDADGNALMEAVTSDPITVTDDTVLTVNVPTSISLALG